jgi:hypothetical protein
MPLALASLSRKHHFADGGSIEVNVTPSGSASGGLGSLPSFTGANSAVPALTAANAAAYPTMPAATPVAQPSFNPQPYSNAVANVPVGGTSGAPVSPQIAQIGSNGVPMGSPGMPVQTAQSALNIPPAAARGGTIKKKKFAAGGPPTSAEEVDPWYLRQDARGMIHPEGLIQGMAGGRTDVHNINVPSGSYILPSDVVSGLAEGNTMAGSGVIDRMMHSGPGGINMSGGRKGGGMGIPRAPRPFSEPMGQARGGASAKHTGELVPIIVAGGEHIIYPGTIAKKFGNLSKGHKILDKFVLNARKQTIDDMKKLKPPKK